MTSMMFAKLGDAFGRADGMREQRQENFVRSCVNVNRVTQAMSTRRRRQLVK
jgi:hypothetical protein